MGSLRCAPAEAVPPEAARFLSSLELGRFRRETVCPSWDCLENRDEARRVCHTDPALNLGLAASLGKVSVHGAAAARRTVRTRQEHEATPWKGGLARVPEPQRLRGPSAWGEWATGCQSPQHVEGGGARAVGAAWVSV